jgi:transposase
VSTLAKGTRYTDEYKREIVRLVTELGKKPADVAEDIGVTTRTVQNWVKAIETHGDDAFPGKGNRHAVDDEIWKQRKRIKELEEENAILKKAMSIFAKDGK